MGTNRVGLARSGSRVCRSESCRGLVFPRSRWKIFVRHCFIDGCDLVQCVLGPIGGKAVSPFRSSVQLVKKSRHTKTPNSLLSVVADVARPPRSRDRGVEAFHLPNVLWSRLWTWIVLQGRSTAGRIPFDFIE